MKQKLIKSRREFLWALGLGLSGAGVGYLIGDNINSYITQSLANDAVNSDISNYATIITSSLAFGGLGVDVGRKVGRTIDNVIHFVNDLRKQARAQTRATAEHFSYRSSVQTPLIFGETDYR